MARTTRKERMERRQVALQKVSNGMGISEVVDFVSAEWGCSRRTARRDCHWALEELQLGLDTHDLVHLISHMATTLQRVSMKSRLELERSIQKNEDRGVQKFAVVLIPWTGLTGTPSSHPGLEGSGLSCQVTRRYGCGRM